MRHFLALEKKMGAKLGTLLRTARLQLTEQEHYAGVSQVFSYLDKEAKGHNEQAHRLLQTLSGNTQSLSEVPFRTIINTFLPHEEEIKPLERNLNKGMTQVPQNPPLEFFVSIQYLICVRRQMRRYLRSRFRLRRLQVRIPSALYERVLCKSVLKLLEMAEVQFYCCLYIICLLEKKWENRSPFDLQEFLTEMLCLMGHVFRDFRLFFLEQDLLLNRERGISGDVALANFSAWAEANLNFSYPRIAEAIKIEGRQTVMGDIPGAVVEALAADDRKPDEPYSHGTGKTSVLSRVSNLLEIKDKDLPLELAHENIADELTLHEEMQRVSRIDEAINYERYLSALTPREKTFIQNTGLSDKAMEVVRRARLSAGEMDVIELRFQACGEQEIARRLNRAIGTVRTQDWRAKQKLRKCYDLEAGNR